MSKIEEGRDYYYNKQGRMVLTELFHIKRGRCCGNGCSHCPFIPKHIKGTTNTNKTKNE